MRKDNSEVTHSLHSKIGRVSRSVLSEGFPYSSQREQPLITLQLPHFLSIYIIYKIYRLYLKKIINILLL